MPDKPSLTIAQAADRIQQKSWLSDPGTAPAVTFAFRATAPSYDNFGLNTKFTKSSADFIDTALEALDLWSDIANINFRRIGSGNSGAQAYSNKSAILIGSYEDAGSGAAGVGFLPGPTLPQDKSGDVWINTSKASMDPTPGDYTFTTMIHEIGHALGLGHPGDYQAGHGVTLSYEKDAKFKEDTKQYSLMSYFSATETGGNHFNISPSTPLLTDIYAIQLAYGPNTTTRKGGTVYGFNSNADRQVYHIDDETQDVVFAIWDAGGDDTLDASGYGRDQTIDLRPGEFSSLGRLEKNVAMAIAPPFGADGLDYFIENAIGGRGPDKIVGNDRANNLEGRAGDDTVLAGDLGDTLTGGNGIDRLNGQDGNDRIEGNIGNDILNGGENSDTAVFSGNILDYNIMHNRGDGIVIVEHLRGPNGRDRLTAIEFAEFDDGKVSLDKTGVQHGGKFGNTLHGYVSQNDYLSGGGGNDTISGDSLPQPEGNPQPGNDVLNGDEGNDTLFDSFGGRDRMFGGEGNDRIVGAFDDRPDLLDGGDDNDSISIAARNDDVADTIRGGSGDDQIGFDTFYANFGRKLEGEDGNDQLNGSRGDDTLDGGADNDVLSGGGGYNLLIGGENDDRLIGSWAAGTPTPGFDTFNGGAGNDIIAFARAGDIVRGGEGGSDFLDIIRYDSVLGFTLNLNRPDARQILADETIITGIDRMHFQGGSGDDILTGAATAAAGLPTSDTLIGNGGNDRLDGGGGDDVLEGGAGNDVFHVDSEADTVQDRTGEGIDTVVTSTSFDLRNNEVDHIRRNEIERLIAADTNDTRPINLTGDDSANLIVANAGKNTLTGEGGSDTLRGGGGNDLYYINGPGDEVREAAGRGVDRVIALDSPIGEFDFRAYVFAAGSEIEFFQAQTNHDMNVTGNEFANNITGNKYKNSINGGAGDDTISGGDGADTLSGGLGEDKLLGGVGDDQITSAGGKDTLAGGIGDDLYLIITSGEQVIVEDEHDDGFDTVQSAVSHRMAPGVERLYLTGNEGDQIALGNASANQIYGHGFNCTIDGLGGADTLYGGLGRDNFRFSSPIGAEYDGVELYTPAHDTILLSRSIFTGIASGELAEGAFMIGQVALDPDDRVIYNFGSGDLYFDADGSKPGASRVLFAVLDPGLKLTSADFVIV
ncbi:hypothetical protein BH10PSE7_BH10PSE7_18730 [soil metagenome]